MEDPHAPMAHKPDELPVDSESTFAAPKVEAGTAKAEPENFRSSQRFSIREVFANEIPWSQRSSAQQWFPFRGMWHDLKRRAPYYLSDWSLALSPENLPRVVFSTIRMYALNLMPALAYTLDMNERTEGAYGVNETLLATAMAAIIFPIFGVQPLTIVGFTGLISLFNYTNYQIVHVRHGVDFLQFQCWVYLWGAILHWIAAVLNMSDYTRFITDMTGQAFGFYVGIVVIPLFLACSHQLTPTPQYITKGIELLVLEFEPGKDAGWLSCFIAVVFSLSVYYGTKAGHGAWGPLWLRQLILDATFWLSLIWWSAFANIPGNMKDTHLLFLPITKAFSPTADRSWFIPFWELPVKWIFVALPFGFLLTLLFWFDHNVSSLLASARKFPVARPSGYHWDFFLLGIMTLVAGFLGLPAPNGLVPQAPDNTESLSIREQLKKKDSVGEQEVRTTRVVEQRLSHLAMGLLVLGTMSRPLLVALGTMPRAVFAGIFLVVGWGSIEGNTITQYTLYILRDPTMIPDSHPLKRVKKMRVFRFVIVQWFVFAVAYALSHTIAAIGFPVPYIALIPFRYYVLPGWFTREELAILDAPVANSEAVINSIGGDLDHVTGSAGGPLPDKYKQPLGESSHQAFPTSLPTSTYFEQPQPRRGYANEE